MIPSNNWFYCWLTRLLLERVTLFVKEHSVARYGEPKKLKIEYSNRGGLSYAQMNAYYSWLKFKSSNRRPFLPLGNLSWEVMHPSLLEVYEHNSRAGLHFADAVGASFFKAYDKHDTGECDPQFAKLFLPRMARHPDKASGRISGFGLKLMPGLRKANLDSDQTEIFRFYGYPGQWWAPDPTVP